MSALPALWPRVRIPLDVDVRKEIMEGCQEAETGHDVSNDDLTEKYLGDPYETSGIAAIINEWWDSEEPHTEDTLRERLEGV